MKNYIIEERKTNAMDGYWLVVVEGETHLNRTVIQSSIQFFTLEGGYDYNHPWAGAKEHAQAIADGLNAYQRLKYNISTQTPEMLSLNQLKAMPPNTAFATGECVNSIHGINMEAKYQGRMLRWVAVRGGIHDWCIVCDWADEKSLEEVKEHGQKIVNKKYIQALVPATEEAMNWYRM